MSATPINSEINFMDEEKRSLCEKVQEIINKDDGQKFGPRSRLMIPMTVLGVTFLEELTKDQLKKYLKFEEAESKGLLKETVEEDLKNSFHRLYFNQ